MSIPLPALKRRFVVPLFAACWLSPRPLIWIAGDFIFVSGTLGTVGGKGFTLIDGGIGAETTQALANIETILASCDADFSHVAKVNVFVTDIAQFADMNAAYVAFLKQRQIQPPARITVGKAALALNATVEIDCVAYKPSKSLAWIKNCAKFFLKKKKRGGKGRRSTKPFQMNPFLRQLASTIENEKNVFFKKDSLDLIVEKTESQISECEFEMERPFV